MTLDQALNIGTTAYGSIKATYAELYDKDGNKLFSLQNKDATLSAEWLYAQTKQEYGKAAADNLIIGTKINPTSTLILNGKVPGNITPDGKLADLQQKTIGETGDLVYDFTQYHLPVVGVSSINPNERGMIPVKLLYDAESIIRNKIVKRTKYYKLYVSYYKYKNGVWGEQPERVEDVLIAESYHPIFKSEFFQGNEDFRFNLTYYNKHKGEFKDQDWWKYYIGTAIMDYYANRNTQSIPKFWGSLRKKGDRAIYNELVYGNNEKAYMVLLRTQEKQDKFPYLITDIEFRDEEIKDEPAAQYRKLIDILNSNDTFYVKPWAFDWNAINIKAATAGSDIVLPSGEVIKQGTNIIAALEAAYQKAESAKNLLVLAGASSLL